MAYVDGFVLVVPTKKVKEYRRVSALAGKVWREHGALQYVECVGDEFVSKHEGKTYKSIFPKMAGAKAGETVVFSWILYKSKADRNRVNKKVMADERLSKMMDPNNMPFDMARMAMGGFKSIVDLR